VSPARRRLLSRLLAGLAVSGVLLAAIAAYAGQTLFDSDTFSNRAVSVLDDEAVQAQLASAITDAAIGEVPNAIAARPLIESVSALLVRSPALQSVLAKGVRDVHETAIEGNEDTLVVTLANIGVLIRQGLQAAAPKLADQISRKLDVTIINEGDGEGEGLVIDAAQLGTDLKILHWILLAVALAAAAGSVALAPTRLAGIRRLGRSLAIGGVAAVIVWQVGRGLLVAKFEGDASDTVGAIYNAFLGDLRTWLLVLSGFGIVITAGASSTREPLDVPGLLSRGWARLTTVPRGTPKRIARALLLIVAGVLLIQNRDAAVTITVIVVGAFVIYVGAAELMRLAAGAVRVDEATPSDRRDAESDLSMSGLARVTAVGILLLGAFVLLGLRGNEAETPPLVVSECNGSVELCDRPLDQIAFAATHNSMSAATYDDWFFAQQEKGISEQLSDGIRALLVDPHYGVKTNGGVATDLESDIGSRQKIEAGLGPEAVAAAEQIRRQIGYDGGGETKVFLCHGFCEVGSVPWVSGLREVRDFLTANPGEVVVMSIEDATTPPDTVAGFDEAGLTKFVYKGPDEPLPTLREMIDLNQRLFVMAERDGGDPTWYRRQFDITQETPFKFEKPEQLTKRSSCDENRGPADAPFFLMNNWVDTSPAPRPTNAKKVNRKDFLLDRVAMCTRIRGVQPNILAVDFYKEGNVFGAVDELNGVSP
jgi:hypothetical protein